VAAHLSKQLSKSVRAISVLQEISERHTLFLELPYGRAESADESLLKS
jgi:hypothetical protein